MSNSKQKEKIALHRRLEKLTQEEKAVRKGLEYVRLARQKNNIEGLEIRSKMSELITRKQSSDTEKKLDQEKSDDLNKAINDIYTEFENANRVEHFVDAVDINKTQLHLGVDYRLFQDDEIESDDSD